MGLIPCLWWDISQRETGSMNTSWALGAYFNTTITCLLCWKQYFVLWIFVDEAWKLELKVYWICSRKILKMSCGQFLICHFKHKCFKYKWHVDIEHKSVVEMLPPDAANPKAITMATSDCLQQGWTIPVLPLLFTHFSTPVQMNGSPSVCLPGLHRSVDEPFIWIRCVETGKRLIHAGHRP